MSDFGTMISRVLVLASLAGVAAGCSTRVAPLVLTPPSAEPVVEAEVIVRALEPTRYRGPRVGGEDGRITIPIRFASGSTALDPAAAPQVRQIARALSDLRLHGARIEVAGHTDDRGAADVNQRVSEERAAAVKAALERELRDGAVTLTARGYGETRPLPGLTPTSPEGRAANRRVELVSLGRTTGTEAAALRLDVQPERNVGGQAMPLRAGDVLTSGSGYRLIATPTHECHLYVFQMDGAGTITQLFPNAQFGTGENPVAGKRQLRLPGTRMRWFELDDVVGRERIVALASATRLANARQRAIDAANGVAARGDGPDRGLVPGAFGPLDEPGTGDEDVPSVLVWSLEFEHR